MNINNFLDEHTYSDRTRHQYAYLLSRVIRDLDLDTLDAQQLRAWLTGQGWSGAMRWQYLCAIRAYLRWAHGPDHPALRLRIRRERSGPQPALDMARAEKLFQSFGEDAKGVRDLAIAAVLLDTGLREFELCGLRLRDVHLRDLWLSALIKGGRIERVIYSQATGILLRRWLDVRSEIAAQPDPGTLFVSTGGTRPGTALTPPGLKSIVTRWGHTAGIGHITPHMFRRGFAILATQAGAPSRLVQLAGRWSSIDMVELYTRALDLEQFREYSPVELLLK